jgi:hypothetical protein
MSWQPGQRVVTEQDRVAWQAWRKQRRREQQRERRARFARIDYYPDERAAMLIEAMTEQRLGGDLSSVINRIVGEWADAKRRRVPPE